MLLELGHEANSPRTGPDRLVAVDGAGERSEPEPGTQAVDGPVRCGDAGPDRCLQVAAGGTM